jgi:hypothetical protein
MRGAGSAWSSQRALYLAPDLIGDQARPVRAALKFLVPIVLLAASLAGAGCLRSTSVVVAASSDRRQRRGRSRFMEETAPSKIRRNWIFARHLRPRQIVRRVQLDYCGVGACGIRPVPHPPVRPCGRISPMRPRRGLDRTHGDRWRFTFLNQSLDFDWPDRLGSPLLACNRQA